MTIPQILLLLCLAGLGLFWFHILFVDEQE